MSFGGGGGPPPIPAAPPAATPATLANGQVAQSGSTARARAAAAAGFGFDNTVGASGPQGVPGPSVNSAEPTLLGK